MNKKGISPLIATVLIIGFTVALAAIVMTWGSTFIRETTETTERSTSQAIKCATDLSFDITNVSCSSTGGSKLVVVDNRGNVDIKSLMFRIHYENGSVVKDLTAGASGLAKYEVTPYTVGAIDGVTTKVEAISTIAGEAGQEDYTCVEAVQKFLIDCNG